MKIVCPFYNYPYYSYTIDLSSQTYTLRFRFSDRSEGYLMDIEDAEENVIIYGVQMVPYYPLLRQYSLNQEIPGDFVLVPIEETDLRDSEPHHPRRIDQTHILIYSDEGF